MKTIAMIIAAVMMFAANFGDSDPWGAKKVVSNLVLDTPLPVYASTPEDHSVMNGKGVIKWEIEGAGDAQDDLEGVTELYSSIPTRCVDIVDFSCSE